MEIVLFIGIQAAGKSEFYKQHFYKTHIRINLDMLRTRNRENILIDACLKAKQDFVVDNTNATRCIRKKYIDQAKQSGFKVIGYYFQSSITDALVRNQTRSGKEKVPVPAILATAKKLEQPKLVEGFDQLLCVSIKDNNFVVEEYKHD